ncbi:MAG: hypothetical protein DMG35_21390 [Acidobacteria bacterium]|nr:MAG: hypothetical protein DMG35_21390 [Acidobacteriota bacterium]
MAAAGPGAGPWAAAVKNGAAALAANGPTLPSQFFSFDYPDSQASALRGINNFGKVSGFFRLPGNPARHGSLATPSTDQGEDNNN